MQNIPQFEVGEVTATNFQDSPYSAWGFHHVRNLHPSARVWRGSAPAVPFEAAPDNLLDYMQIIRGKPPHGGAFHYVSPNAVVLGWVLEAVTGERFADLLSTHMWQPMGAEHDADLIVDRCGRSQTEGGLNVSLRDLARFGELHRCEGALNGRQVVPAGWIEDLRENGDARAWDAGVMKDFLPGHHYRSQWYTHREHPRQPFFTLGAFGQTVYVDPVAEIVAAKLSCHPGPESAFDNVLLAFRAIADAFSTR